MRVLAHLVCILGGLALCLGLPALSCLPRLAGGPDAVSGATMELPELPSGEFVVFLNRTRHTETEAWERFFLEQPVDVIMEDLKCLTVRGDAGGAELARRYQARLAEHQMELREEEALLVLSRAELGRFDTLILSKEVAIAYDFSAAGDREDVITIFVGDAS